MRKVGIVPNFLLNHFIIVFVVCQWNLPGKTWANSTIKKLLSWIDSNFYRTDYAFLRYLIRAIREVTAAISSASREVEPMMM